MCGINGFNWKDKNLIKKMNSCLIHRGPNQKGIYSNSTISLGHTRLSIIDLSIKGKQPMYDSTKKVWIVFNGEIYNFQSLRKELREKGYIFKSKTDTEVIIYSYIEWGFNCVKKFNGMWAFCIYDIRKKILFLSRDRVGQKPLFYYFDGKKFIFSSELKSILKHKIKREINKDAIDFYLTIGFIPSPLSIYKQVFKVEPRQSIIFDIKKKKISKLYYYKPSAYKPTYKKKKLIEEGRTLLKDATRLRLISDVPVGAFLSGGLDSSSVVSMMSNFLGIKNLHTFSMGFEGIYDETHYINLARNMYQTKHHHEYFKEKHFNELLNKIPYYCDEPLDDYSGFPAYKLSKSARKNVTVLLSGDGGDEIFGGYPKYCHAARIEFIRKFPKWIRQSLYWILPNIKKYKIRVIKELLRDSFIPPERFYSENNNYFAYVPSIFKKWSSEKLKEILKISNNNFLEAIIKYDLFYNDLGDKFLVKVDRISMANSLEVRSPFLDHRFIEYSAKIPVKWKINSFKTKILMRHIIKPLVPKKLLNLKKKGFIPPTKEWINKKEYLDEIKEGIEKLHYEKVLNNNWYTFYKTKVLSTNHLLCIYKIRLLLLWRWWKIWINKF